MQILLRYSLPLLLLAACQNSEQPAPESSLAESQSQWAAYLEKLEKDFPRVSHMSAETLARKLPEVAAGQTLLVDVRRPDEFAVSRIPGAVHVPEGKGLVQRVKELSAGRPVVLYCAMGYRSSRAANQLMQAGLTKVHNLEGSIFHWANAGLPLENDLGQVCQVHPCSERWSPYLNVELRAELDK